MTWWGSLLIAACLAAATMGFLVSAFASIPGHRPTADTGLIVVNNISVFGFFGSAIGTVVFFIWGVFVMFAAV